MKRTLLVWILLSTFPAYDAVAGFILDPNTGTYVSSDVAPRPAPQTTEEKRAAAAYNNTLNTALGDYGKYFRFYRYVFAGVGAKGGSVVQGGNKSSQDTGIVGTAGFDIDGLTWPAMYTLELRGTFGFSPPTGETSIFWYLATPISKAWIRRDISVPSPVNQDVKRGVPFGRAVLDHGAEIEDWAKQFTPLRVELGIGYQGISYDADGGTVVDGGASTRATTTGMIAGLAYAARLGYFGERDMVRLTGYYLASNRAKTGGKFADGIFLGTEVDIDATTKGRALSAKLDWYHRLDERVRRGSWISGYGVSLIGRRIHLDEGSTSSWRGGIPGGGMVATTFPAQDVTQLELLVTLGYLR